MTQEISNGKEFVVDLCRTGFGFASIEVLAKDEFEAQQLALDSAGNLDYNEKSSEYALCAPVPSPAEKAAMSRPPMQLILELQSVDADRTSTVGGATISVNHALLLRLQSIVDTVKTCGLSEARFHSEPDSWLGHQEGVDVGLVSTEFVVGKSWLALVGQDNTVECEARSMGVELATLLSFFNEGVERLVVLQGNARADDLSFVEEAGFFDDVDSIENMRVMTPFELVPQNDLQARFDDYRGVMPHPRD